MGAKFTLTNPGAFGGIAKDAVKIPMLEIWRDARTGCPVKSGNLANSILPDGPHSVGTYGAEATVGTNVYYGIFVEVGTKYMAARPFLGNALAKAKAKYGA